MDYKSSHPPPDHINAPHAGTHHDLKLALKIIAGFFFAVLFIVTLFPPVMVVLTPKFVEKKLGEFGINSIVKKPGRSLGDGDQRLVERIKKALAPDLQDIQVRLMEASYENAFALPGGQVLLTDLFLKRAKSDNEKIFVIAHEFGHIAKQHSLKRIYSQFLLSIVKIFISGESKFFNILFNANTMTFSRFQEKEADLFALDVLHKTSQSAEGGFDFFKRKSKLLEKYQSDFFSTHPFSHKRVDYLTKECMKKFGLEFCERK